MNPVKVEVRGLNQVKEAIRLFGQEVAKSLDEALNATGLETISDVKRAIQRGPKTGRKYQRGRKVHIASAPGQAPATDTGALVSSIYYRRIDDYTVAVGSRLDYAFHLEFGTRRMAARPSWLPAAEKNAARLQKRIARIIREAKARAEGRM